MATNRVTGVGLEVLHEGDGSNARVTGVGVEVLRSVTPLPPPPIASYDNLGGVGPRRSVFKLTSTLPIAAGSSSRPIECVIDGIISSTSKPFMTSSTTAANRTLEFELLGLPRIITGYRWYQSAAIPPLSVAFEGWNGSTWDTLSTDLLNSQGVSGSTPYVASFANTTAYQKYRFREDSGNWGSGTPIWQIEFEISGVADEAGDRQSTITVTTTMLTSRSPSNFVDGAYLLNVNDSFWPNAQSIAGLELKFQFATPRVVKYARSECRSYTGSQGDWKWQGSNDGSSWTDIGSTFTWNMTDLTVGAGETPVHDLSSNTTAYSYYRMLGVSGSVTTAPYWQEMYFDIEEESDAPEVDLEVAFEGEGTLTAELTTTTFVDLEVNFLGEGEFVAQLTAPAPANLEATFLGEGTFTTELTAPSTINLEVNFLGEGTLTAEMTVIPVVKLEVNFLGEGTFTAHVAPPPVNLEVSYTDEARFNLLPLRVFKPVTLQANFTDEGKLTAAIYEGVSTVGPFYFAWVNPEDDTFNSSFLREDEDVFSFNITQSEGDFAQLSVVIQNPRVGLLAPSRKTWIWLSYFDGTVLKPLFFGRLIGLPSNIFDVRVKLEFVARPQDFAFQKEVLAQSLRVAPYFDPLFVSPDYWDDPDVVLEARSEVWHIDRVTHRLTTSDVLVPEDGVIELTEDDHLYAGLSTSMSGVPARRVRLEANLPWTMRASGEVDLRNRIKSIWESPLGISTQSQGGLISSYTFDGLSGDWPAPGRSLSTGWTVVQGSLINVAGVATPGVQLKDILKSQGMPFTDSDVILVPAGTAVYRSGDPNLYGVSTQVTVPIGWGFPILKIQYDVERSYSETVTIDLEADMQAIMTMPGDDEAVVVRISGNDASDRTRDGSIPQNNSRSPTFAESARGRQALEHLILHARAVLINRSRAVTITCKMAKFLDALDVTLRKGLLIYDPRLPGGQALGKVTSYNISYSNGTPSAQITIQSAVGYGGSESSEEGEDSYIDDDYIEDYYVRDNEIVALPASDVAYTVPIYRARDDGIDFRRGISADQAVRSLVVTGGPRAQQIAMNEYVGTSADLEAVKTALNGLPTQVHADMLPLAGGPYSTPIAVVVSKLSVPKQIDLEAAT